MSQRNRFEYAALGLVIGLGFALLFFVWAFPWFSDPTQCPGHYPADSHQATDQARDQDNPHFWVGPFYGWLFAEDSLPQWIMATFTVLATGISIFAVILVDRTLKANTEAVDQARAANDIARDNGIAQIRAYLNVIKIELNDAVGEYAPRITVHYKNFGQTPARNVVNAVTITFALAGEPMRKDRIPKAKGGYDIGAGQESATTTHFSFDMMKGLREAVEERAATLFVSGRITYRDVFGEERYTRYRFRLYVDPEGISDTDAFIICDEGNEST